MPLPCDGIHGSWVLKACEDLLFFFVGGLSEVMVRTEFAIVLLRVTCSWSENSLSCSFVCGLGFRSYDWKFNDIIFFGGAQS